MRKSNKKQSRWPNIYSRLNRTGSKSWMVDLGLINGKRERHCFKTKEEAETFADQTRIKKQNEGLAAFAGLTPDVRADAGKANELLKQHHVSLTEAARTFVDTKAILALHGISIPEAARGYVQHVVKESELLKPYGATIRQAVQYYIDHVLRYSTAPNINTIIDQMLKEAEGNNRRDRTIADLRHRLKTLGTDFGDRKLADLQLDEIKEWVADEDWAPQTRINYLTKISQLFNFGIKHGWCEHNLCSRIDRPDVDDKEPKIFTVEEAKALVKHAGKFELLPFISIGLFAGLRTAELQRLDWSAVRLEDKSIIVGADVAKKRSRRVVELSDNLVELLKPVMQQEGKVVPLEAFRDRLEALKAAAGIKDWPHNGLRHSFGSYHLAHYGDQIKTAQQMGHRDASVVHNHYKALVMRVEAERFWSA